MSALVSLYSLRGDPQGKHGVYTENKTRRRWGLGPQITTWNSGELIPLHKGRLGCASQSVLEEKDVETLLSSPEQTWPWPLARNLGGYSPKELFPFFLPLELTPMASSPIVIFYYYYSFNQSHWTDILEIDKLLQNF